MTARLLAASGLLLSLLAAAYLALADTYSSQSCVSDGTSTVCTDKSSSTLIEENGAWVLLLLAVPICLAAAQLLLVIAHGPAVLKSLVAGVFLPACLIALFSLGVFFLPAALVSAVALLLDRPCSSQPV